MKFKKITKKESGFTLVELIVAVGIFGILSVLVTGAFLNIMSIQKQAESRQQIMNDFRVTLDLVGKEILDGAGFRVVDGSTGTSAEDGIDSLYFQARVRHDMMSRVIQYKVVDGRIMKAQQDTLEECQVTGGTFLPECFVPFTSEEVFVEELVFYINNFDEDEDYGHPIITIVTSGRVDLPGASPSFRTSVSFSPRNQISPDFEPLTDTTDPDVVIQEMDGVGVSLFPLDNLTANETVTLNGEVRDTGGSGIQIVRLRVYNQDETSILYTDSISTGFTPGSTDWFSWEFQDVKLHTAGLVSHVEVTATDLSGNTGNDKIKVRSDAPPPNPNPPTLDLWYTCLATSTDVDYVTVRMYSTNTDIDYYEIEKDGVFHDVNRTGDYTDFYDHGVSRGNDYTYVVRAVRSDWTFDVKSSPVSETISLGANICSVPGITFFANDINCDLSNSPSINLRARSQWWGRTSYFEILDHVGNSIHSSPAGNWWWGADTYPWSHESPLGLPPGTYEYEARVCLGNPGDGGDCSTSTPPTSLPNSLDIDALTCVPPDTSFWDFHSGVQCSVDGDGDPSILLNLTVQREAPIPSEVRPFDTYVIDERVFGDPVWSEIERCPLGPDNPLVIYDCVEKHFPRVDAQYEYRVRALNINSGWLGNPGFYSVTIDGSMCDGGVGGWSDGPGGSVEANLFCTEEPAHDFREVEVSVTDDYADRDPAAIYRFYKCTSNVSTTCEPVHFDQITRAEQQAGEVAVDEGPADDTIHWYGTEICNFDGSICSGMTFDHVVINPEECDPQTPIIITTTIGYPSWESCHSPTALTRDILLTAIADNSSDLIRINIYRDGGLIAGNRLQGTNIFDVGVTIGDTVTYGFEACYSLAAPPCGPIYEEDFTVVENICDPTTPDSLSSSISCNDLGQITAITLGTSGSNYHDGYYIERSNPATPSFSCYSDACTDTFSSPITNSVTYTYRSRSYRDTLVSAWKTRDIDLDPLVYCDSPFELDYSPNYILVTVTGSGPDQTSTAAQIGVNPTGTFSSSVDFDASDIKINLLPPMINAGVTESEVNASLSRSFLDSPYDTDKPILTVKIPDKDYLGSNEYLQGAEIIVVGESEGFEAGVTVPLIIRWESGSQD